MNEVERSKWVTHTGGCHCGAVQFEVDAPARVRVDECNCSICDMSGFEHLIVSAEQFRLVSGEEQLREYQFGTRTARHLFCGRCGVKSFYVPRSHPDGFSVNLRCVNQETVVAVQREEFDGQQWEQNIDALRRET